MAGERAGRGLDGRQESWGKRKSTGGQPAGIVEAARQWEGAGAAAEPNPGTVEERAGLAGQTTRGAQPALSCSLGCCLFQLPHGVYNCCAALPSCRRRAAAAAIRLLPAAAAPEA